MESIRYEDVLGFGELEELYTFKKFPSLMKSVNTKIENDKFEDMTWCISKGSGLIQLKNLIPLKDLYESGHNPGVVGNVWMNHHEKFANFIGRFAPRKILEIGGGHGILSRFYMSSNSPTSWNILEPDPTPSENVKANYIKAYFDNKYKLDSPVDAIVHSHVFEHVYNPLEFAQLMADSIDYGKFAIFSVPNMQEMLIRKYTNTLSFEHTLLLSEPYIRYIMQSSGFELISKEYYLQDHSIFFAFKKVSTSTPVNTYFDTLYDLNKEIFDSFIEFHQNEVNTLNLKLQELSSKNQPTYLFGAHIFSQYLLGFGLNSSCLTGILDNDTDKQGKRLYGTNLNIFSPNILKGAKMPIVILKAGSYSEEIKEDILKNINPDCIFL